MIIFLVPDSSRHIRRSTMVLSRTFVQAIRQYEALAGQVHLVREQSPAIFSSLEELASDDTPSILIRTGRQIEPLSRLIEELNRIERSASSPLERMISERKLARYTREREIVGELEERYMHLFDAYVEEATSRLRGMLGQLKESFDKRDMVLLQASRQEISLLAGAISSGQTIPARIGKRPTDNGTGICRDAVWCFISERAPVAQGVSSWSNGSALL